MKPLSRLLAATAMTLALTGTAAADPVFQTVGGSSFSVQFGSPGLYLSYNTGPFAIYKPWTFRPPVYPYHHYGIYQPYAYQQYVVPTPVPQSYWVPAPGYIVKPGQPNRGAVKHFGKPGPGTVHKNWNRHR